MMTRIQVYIYDDADFFLQVYVADDAAVYDDAVRPAKPWLKHKKP